MSFTRRQMLVLLCFLIAGFTVLAYLPVAHHGFVSLDDYQYIRDNKHVTSGLSRANIVWAFQSDYACNWHPLTWLSHMLDCQLFGLNAGAHHLTSVFIHALNSVLVFLLMVRFTRILWPSAFVAAFFAWHPIHVESVAWVSERKDVLCGLFWLLALFAYGKFAEYTSILGEGAGKGAGRREERVGKTGWYVTALLLFAMALMSKPMAVTLPFVLLLLDFWPFERWSLEEVRTRPRAVVRLVLEKLPFFALAIGASLITFIAQDRGGATASLRASGMSDRLANAAVSYVRYVGKTFWPSDLAALYPFNAHLPWGLVCGALLLVISLSVVCLLVGRRHGFLFTGWFWFVGTLVPVIGLVQVGAQSMADRYMYLPSIGLLVALIWGLMRLQDRLGLSDGFFSGAGVVAASLCLGCTVLQVRHWESTERLARRAIEIVPDNYLGYNLLGKALDDKGRKDGALYYVSRACEISPTFAEAQFNYGTLLFAKGAVEDSALHFHAALKGQPDYLNALHGLGNALFRMGKFQEAETNLARAVTLAPEDAEVHHDLGTVLLAQGKFGAAEAELARAVQLHPTHVEARRNLGVALAQQGRVNEALPQFAKASELAPNEPDMRFNYGLALLSRGDLARATEQFIAGEKLRPNEARFQYRLASSFSRQGKFAEAAQHYRRTLEIEPDFAEALNELASILASANDGALRSGPESVRLATRACELVNYKEPRYLTTLAAAYAETGRYTQATKTAKKASELASAAGDKQSAERAHDDLLNYESGRPLRKDL